jgi:methionyl-tRNA formyltransferase
MTQIHNNSLRLAFFGSSTFSVHVLDELRKSGYIPALIVTTPDKPKGRKLVMAPTPVKEWAEKKGILVYQPAKLDTAFIKELKEEDCRLFIVASYGKIIPEALINLPADGTLNVHPSLLPKYRGPSPIQAAMLDNDKNTGVTIMSMDAEIDHGPIVARVETTIDQWPPYEELEEKLARQGGRLLADILPDWLDGTMTEEEQDHATATMTAKITKEDGLIDLSSDPYENFLKIQAFHSWPGTYFFIEKDGRQLRVKITKASYSSESGILNIERVIPEGSKEMDYEDFKRGYGDAGTP